MYLLHICFFIFFLHTSYSDWVSEWLNPISQHYKSVQNSFGKPLNVDDLQLLRSVKKIPENMQMEKVSLDFPLLETALIKSKILIEALKKEISREKQEEIRLKDAIANGRMGVTIASVTMIGRSPRTYIVRNESWTMCEGSLLLPNYNGAPLIRHSLPKCSGQEISANRDACVFNSIIKYQTIPTMRRSIYKEDDYICQKSSFDHGFEKYTSVPSSIIKQTCENDVSKSLTENLSECGPRIITEYTMYPYNRYLSTMPVGYCNDYEGTCKLTVAWHLTNVSIENFEFFEIDERFKQFFINSE